MANKAALADAIRTDTAGKECLTLNISADMRYVLDGGSLLYRIPWPRGATFDAVFKIYLDHIKKFRQPVVVFDGYQSGPSTKDVAHLRRANGVVGVQVNFDDGMNISCKKEHFLANSILTNRDLSTCLGNICRKLVAQLCLQKTMLMC